MRHTPFAASVRIALRSLIDAVLPPRESERIVRSLSVHELRALARAPGEAHGDRRFLLPYRQESATALVRELKYYGSERAALLCAALLEDELLALAQESLGVPLLVPIPMHSGRRRERGFNQTEVLCEAVINRLHGDTVAYTPQALMRVRLTPSQQGLPRAARLGNVAHSMRADEDAVRGRTVIVLDDVTTTGATLSEARRALLAAGAERVHLLALAG